MPDTVSSRVRLLQPQAVLQPIPKATSALFNSFSVNNIQDIPVPVSVTGFVMMVAIVLMVSAGNLLLFHQNGWS